MSSIRILSIGVLLFFFTNSVKAQCSNCPDKPTVITSAVDTIAYSNSIDLKGSWMNSGSSPIKGVGIRYGVSDSFLPLYLTKQTSRTRFAFHLSLQAEGTEYYYQAFAFNDTDTGYGEIKSFVYGQFVCDSSFILDVDGNLYSTVQIGNQCWLGENLKTEHYRNGKPLNSNLSLNEWQNDTSGSFVHYNNASSNSDIYGSLYNWYAVTNQNKLCPKGWKTPSQTDWSQLVSFAGGNQIAGQKLRSVNTWSNQSGSIAGTDDYGFSALASGAFGSSGSMWLGTWAGWWTSTTSPNNNSKAVSRSTSGLSAQQNYQPKFIGISCRCIKE